MNAELSNKEGVFNVAMPPGTIEKGSEVLFKINPQKKPEEKVHKFRSFRINTNGGTFYFGNHAIFTKWIYELLIEHGLSSTLPSVVDFTAKVTKFQNFDWHPSAYSGPAVWYLSLIHISEPTR